MSLFVTNTDIPTQRSPYTIHDTVVASTAGCRVQKAVLVNALVEKRLMFSLILLQFFPLNKTTSYDMSTNPIVLSRF